MDKAQKRFMDKRVDHTQPNDPALFCEAVAPGKVRVHSRPIRYGDDTGVQRPITVNLTRSGTDWVEDRNTIRFKASDAGHVGYQVGDHRLQLRLAGRALQRPSEVSEETPTATPTVTRPDGSRVLWDGMLGDEFHVEHQVGPGIVKEIITLPAEPPLGTAETYAIVWQWQSATLIPMLLDGSVHWRDAQNETIIRFPRPKVWDASDRVITGVFGLLGDRLRIAISADELRAAAYPVTIDPTATTGSADVTDSVSIYEELVHGSYDDYVKAFAKFINLPDLTGYAIDTASVFLYGEETELVDPYTLHFDITGAWTGASSVGTLDALSFNDSTDSDTGSTLNTWQENNILGDATKGLQKIYDDAGMDPSALTATLMIRYLYYAGYTSDTTRNGSLMMGHKGDARWAEDDDATYYPRIEIDYSAPTHTVTGTPSMPAMTCAGVGEALKQGPGVLTMSAMTCAGIGEALKQGPGVLTMSAMTCAGIGEALKQGPGVLTMSAMTCAGVSVVSRFAAGTPSAAAMTCAGEAVRVGDVPGAVTMPAMECAGVGEALKEGAGTPSLSAMTCSGVGVRVWTATATPSMSVMTCAGVGILNWTGTGAADMGVMTSGGAGKMTRKATGTPSMPVMVCAGVGILEWTATGTPSLAAMTCAGAVESFVSSPGDVETATMECAGVVVMTRFATGTPSAAAMTCSGAIVRTGAVTGALTLGTMTCSGVASFTTTVTVTSAMALTALTMAGAASFTTSHTATSTLSLAAMACAGAVALTAGPATHTVTSALSLAAMTCAGVGVAGRSGTGAVASAAMTCSGVVAVLTLHSVTGTPSTPAMTCSGACVLTHTSTSASSTKAMTCSGAATRVVTTASSLALNVFTVATVASRTFTRTVTGAVTTAAMTCAGGGVLGPVFSATGTSAMAVMTCSGAGVRTVTMTGASSFAAMTASGSVSRDVPTIGVLTIGAMASSGVITLSHTGTAALSMGAMTARIRMDVSSWSDSQWYRVRRILEGEDDAPVRMAQVEAVKAPTARTPA